MDDRSREISILIADGQTLFREGLRELLEEQPDFRVVGEAAEAQDASRLANSLEPEILLLDIALGGAEVLRALGAAACKARTILLAAAIDGDKLWELFDLGARGVILRESPTAMLLKCIRSVAAGQLWVVQEPVSSIKDLDRGRAKSMEAGIHARRFGLTGRELEVLVTVIAGKTNRQIADQFSISEQTVKHHLTHIFDKVGVYNRLELALFAIHHGLVRRAEP